MSHLAGLNELIGDSFGSVGRNREAEPLRLVCDVGIAVRDGDVHIEAEL